MLHITYGNEFGIFQSRYLQMLGKRRQVGSKKYGAILSSALFLYLIQFQEAVAAFQSEESAFAEQYYRVAAEEPGNMVTISLLMLLGGTLYVVWRFVIVFLSRIPFVRSFYESIIPENESTVSLKSIAGKGDKSDNAVSSQET